ncbi:hypothetical protein JYU34_018875 [Plutella xylostella]|uniref:Odorant receptor n=1 Tax=Plutella xylostella TaxID=51655 RepID=A0ABQ7PYQ6_PLUXY|nr:hypothetical protein JYU34_018875 [Plutella xylostella]
MENERYYRKIHRTITLSTQYLFLLFQIIDIIRVFGDLEAVSQASYILFTQACLVFKITLFLATKNSLRLLLEQMNSQVFMPQSTEQERILKLQASKIKRLLLAFAVSSQATCGMWALKPLFDDAGEREFPFRMWMPVGTEKSLEYIAGYAFQLLSVCTSAYIYFGVDSVALCMVIFGCAQLDVIKDKIVKIKPVTMEDRAAKRALNIFQDNYKILVECIIQHQKIVKFTERIENTYHTYLLFQLSGGVGLICMSALRILVVDWQSMQFFSIITYLSVMIMQMYVCCWCGHELTAHSEELYWVLSEGPWYEQSVQFQRALCFTMLRMRRPMVFRAGHYVPLSRQTFVSILRMSYSYFALLRQTHKN